MNAVDTLCRSLPPHSADIGATLRKVLSDDILSPPRRWGAALACAAASRHRELTGAIVQDAEGAGVSGETLDDARAAASLMAMTNMYYRFKHLAGDPEVAALPSRLRMKRVARPRGDATDFELLCLAVSVLHGCEACIRWHTHLAREAGEDARQLAAAARVAATIHAAAVALDQR